MSDLKFNEIHDEMVRLAYSAGDILVRADPGNNYMTKMNSVDIVTEADKSVEKMISTRLASSFPSIAFMGEETYKPGQRLGPEPTFVVDPIDGTTNFIHSMLNACISLSLSVERKPVIGVIYNPWQNLLYTAVKGCGAYVTHGRTNNPQRLPLATMPRPLEGLGAALVGVEWGLERHGDNFRLKVDVFEKLARAREDGGAMVHSLRSMGSAALNLASVAAGQLDAYWEGGCWAWDVCAGWCILKEAGGIMAGGNPGDWNPDVDGRAYLAIRGAPRGQKELVEEIWSIIGDRKLHYDL